MEQTGRTASPPPSPGLHSLRLGLMDAIISGLFEALALGICCPITCVIRTARSSYRRQNPLYPTLCPVKSRKWEEGDSWPLSSWSNFTHWVFFFFNINKLVTFAPHLAGKVSNNTLSPSENTKDWHAVGSGGPLPHSLRLNVLHISRGQTLAWTGAVQDRGHGFEALSHSSEIFFSPQRENR